MKILHFSDGDLEIPLFTLEHVHTASLPLSKQFKWNLGRKTWSTLTHTHDSAAAAPQMKKASLAILSPADAAAFREVLIFQNYAAASSSMQWTKRPAEQMTSPLLVSSGTWRYPGREQQANRNQGHVIFAEPPHSCTSGPRLKMFLNVKPGGSPQCLVSGDAPLPFCMLVSGRQ